MKDKRESFNSRWGFILACHWFGSWYGKYMDVSDKGIFVWRGFLFDPIFYLCRCDRIHWCDPGEMSFGRAARSGPIDAFGMVCEKKGKRKVGEGLGMIPVLGSLAMAIGYTVVMGWILKYAVGTFTGATLAPKTIEEFADVLEQWHLHLEITSGRF